MKANDAPTRGVRVVLTEEKIRAIGEPMIDAVNAAQMKGATIDEVLCALMIMIGSVIRQRGATLHLDKPLREALPPIALGYEQMDYVALDIDDPKARAFREAIALAREEDDDDE